MGVLIALATVLRIHQLGLRSLWCDEAFSALMSQLPWRDFFALIREREVNMTLYYVLLRAWAALGSSAGWLRGFSVLAGVATVPVLYVLAKRLFGRRTAVVAALLLSVNAYHIRYSQEARSYALTVFFVCLSFLFFVRCVHRASRWDWFGYGVASALAVYCHVYAVLIVLPQVGSLLWWREARPAWREIYRGLRLMAYLCVPLGILAFGIGSAPLASLARPDAHLLYEFVSAFCGNYGWPLAAVSMVGISAAVIVVRPRAHIGIVVAWLLLPISLIVGTSFFHPIFLGRYVIFCLPALCLAMASTTVRLPRWAALALVALLTALSLRGTQRYYAVDFDIAREDWQSASSYIAANADTADGLFFFPGAGRLSYEYYRGRTHSQPAVYYPPLSRSEGYGAFPPTPLAEVFGTPPNPEGRIFLVLSDSAVPPSTDFIRHWCRDHHLRASEHRFEHLLVEVYEPDTEKSAGRITSPTGPENVSAMSGN